MNSSDNFKFKKGDRVVVSKEGCNGGYPSEVLPLGHEGIILECHEEWSFTQASNIRTYEVSGINFNVLEENLAPQNSRMSTFIDSEKASEEIMEK